MTSSSSHNEGSDIARPRRRGDGRAAQAPDAATNARNADVSSAIQDVDTQLSGAIEREVIPRLLRAHSGAVTANVASSLTKSAPTRHSARASGVPVAPQGPACSPQAEAVAHMAIRTGAQAVRLVVERLMQDGASREAVFLEVLAPAARRLGDFWRDDVYAFTDVAIGLCHLRQVFEGLRLHDAQTVEPEDRFTALIAPAPGDTHSFGAAMIAHFFVQAGWSVIAEGATEESGLLRLLKRQHVDLLGVSLNTEHALECLYGFVLKAKHVSRNRDLVVILGGSLIGARPEVARECGAYAAPADPGQAIAQAELLVRRAARRM